MSITVVGGVAERTSALKTGAVKPTLRRNTGIQTEKRFILEIRCQPAPPGLIAHTEGAILRRRAARERGERLGRAGLPAAPGHTAGEFLPPSASSHACAGNCCVGGYVWACLLN